MSLVLSIWSLLLWKSAVASLLDGNPMIHAYSRLPGLRSLNGMIQNALGLAYNRDEGDAMRAARRTLSSFYRRHESSWVIRKRIIDGILLTISDTQTVNGMASLFICISPGSWPYHKFVDPILLSNRAEPAHCWPCSMQIFELVPHAHYI